MVADPAEQGGENHIGKHESGTEQSQLRIGQIEVGLDQGEDGVENLPVDVVEKIGGKKRC